MKTIYQVLDTKANMKICGIYHTRKAASNRADRLDQAYGAVRYVVRFVDIPA